MEKKEKDTVQDSDSDQEENEDLLEKLKIELNATEEGLTTEEVEKRLIEYGPNSLSKKKKGKRDTGATAALQRQLAPTTKAVRDGKLIEVPVDNLVPGDVILLRLGDTVPADAVILPEKDKDNDNVTLKLDQSMLTGESLPAVKHVGERIYAGSVVKKGEARALVELTGFNTFFGKAAVFMVEPKQGRRKLSKKCIEGLADLGMLAMREDNDALKKVNVLVCEKTGILTCNRLEAGGEVWCGGECLRATTAASSNQHWPALRRVVVSGVAACDSNSRDSIDNAVVEWLEKLKKEEQGTELPDADAIIGDVLQLERFDPVNKYALAVCKARHHHQEKEKEEKNEKEKEEKVEKEKKKKKKKNKKEKKEKKDEGGLVAVVKGAPQIIADKCQRILQADGTEEELNEERREAVKKAIESFATRGKRCLGIAATSAKKEEEDDWTSKDSDRNMSTLVGEGWCFLGLVSMEDPPVEGVKEHVRQLMEMGIKLVIATGDLRAIALSFAEDELGWEVEKVKETKDEGEKVENEEKNANEEEEGGKKIKAIEVKRGLLGEEERIDWSTLLSGDIQGAVASRCYPEDKYKIVADLQAQGFVVAVFCDGVGDAPAAKKADVAMAVVGATDSARAVADFVLAGEARNFEAFIKAVEMVRADHASGGRCLIA